MLLNQFETNCSPSGWPCSFNRPAWAGVRKRHQPFSNRYLDNRPVRACQIYFPILCGWSWATGNSSGGRTWSWLLWMKFHRHSRFKYLFGSKPGQSFSLIHRMTLKPNAFFRSLTKMLVTNNTYRLSHPLLSSSWINQFKRLAWSTINNDDQSLREKIFFQRPFHWALHPSSCLHQNYPLIKSGQDKPSRRNNYSRNNKNEPNFSWEHNVTNK